MGLRSSAKNTLTDLSATSQKIGTAAELQTIVLVAVAAVSVMALLVGVAALLNTWEQQET